MLKGSELQTKATENVNTKRNISCLGRSGRLWISDVKVKDVVR